MNPTFLREHITSSGDSEPVLASSESETVSKIVNTASDTQDRTLRWVSADGQGEYTGWIIPAGSAADPVIQECLSELLGQCATEDDRKGILAGTIEIKAIELVE